MINEKQVKLNILGTNYDFIVEKGREADAL